jgi:hypothetical protein
MIADGVVNTLPMVKELKDWIPLLALALSAAVFYHTFLRRFRPSINTTGRVALAKNPWSAGLSQAAISIELIFFNRGVKAGLIENVALRVRTPTGARYTFRAHCICADVTLNLSSELPPPKMETFRAFRLGKEEAARRQILFVPAEGSEAFRFEPGDLAIDVHSWDGPRERWASATPQPGGGFFVSWFIHDMTSSIYARQIERLDPR